MSRRRNSSVSDSFSRRSRSGSMVHTIALNVPVTENRVDLENLGVRHQITKTKSYSSLESELVKLSDQKVEAPASSITYPLTGFEKDNLWLKEVESLKYDYVIDPEDEDEADDIYHSKTYDFIDFLASTSIENGRMLGKSQKIIGTLNKLLTINEKVSAETLNFQEKSDHLLSEVNRLGNLYEGLSSNLTLFESLDGIVKSLNTSSSGSIVASASFNENILKKLDKCLAFVNDKNTSKYKEVAIYKHRFTQCMIRSLSLIKNHVINGFKSTEIIIHNKIKEEKIKLGEGETKSNILSSGLGLLVDAFLYNQFPADIADLKPLITELYERTSTSTADEFTGLLNDCYNQYFHSRSNLLNYVINSHMEANNLKTGTVGIVQLAQSNITFFVKIMKTELDLFKDLFFIKTHNARKSTSSNIFGGPLNGDNSTYDGEYPNGEDDYEDNNLNNDVNLAALNQWFERLLEPLYFLLRNRIIRESSIGDLCELISILQTYSNKDEILGEDEDEDYERSIVIGGNVMYQEETNSLKSIDFETLLRPILQDAQTRLVFRVQAYVEKNIVKYQRTGKELHIGSRRQNANPMIQHDSELDSDLGIDSSTSRNRAESIVSIDDSTLAVDSQALQAIYPPVVKSVKLLTKIYQLLNQGVFDDLANSVVHLVILSMRDNFSKISGIEPKLYQIKNLMFFGEYIATFDIEYTRKETNLDFSGLQNLFRRFYRGDRNKDALEESYGASKVNDSFLATVWGTVPKVVDDYIDCKAELQLALRNAVHEFIQESGLLFTKSLLDYGVTPEHECKKTIEEFTQTAKSELPRLKSIILSYITDIQVLTYLIDGVQESVLKGYEQFYEEVEQSGERAQVEQLLEVDSVRNLWVALVAEVFEELRDHADDDEFNEDDISISSNIDDDLELTEKPFYVSNAESTVDNSLLDSSENPSNT